MEKKDVFKRLRTLAASERKVAVATIVRAHGSTPREVGAKMVILENGDFFGTVGGGCGEAEVWQEARQVLHREAPRTVHVDLTEDPDSGGEKICGGRMDVFVDLWTAADLASLEHIVDLLDQGHGVALSTLIDGAHAGARLFVADDGSSVGTLGDAALDERVRRATPARLAARRSVICAGDTAAPAPRHPAEGDQVFVEILEQPPLLVIAGAGHCALPLASMGKMLGFEIAILDDRPECATNERFPDATTLLVGDLEEQVEHLPLGPNTYMVLVTRGHKQDEQILRRVARRPLGYIGMIGSKRRIRAVFADMARDGYEPEHLDRVFSPIGLDIGAETPEEIAISILGEIIRVRKGGSGQSLTLRRGR